MKVAIVTRADDSSPKVLAFGLKHMLAKLGVESKIFYQLGTLIRLQPLYRPLKHPLPFYKRIYTRLVNWRADTTFLKELENYDLIVISECTPNGFWRNYFNIEQLKKRTKKPVLFYEVYYLGNAPTQIARLTSNRDPLCERYDWHLSVSETTEIRQQASPALRWSNIGLNLEKTNLSHRKKKAFIALVDFAQPGYETYRSEQIKILKKLNIPYIDLKSRYPINELRNIYNKVALYFIQSPEAFGVPIAELFATGAYIFSPDSSWPMAWRLDEKPEVHQPGVLPDIFKVYDSLEDLEQQLVRLRQDWDPVKTPQHVFSRFIEQYPHCYHGNLQQLKMALEHVVAETN